MTQQEYLKRKGTLLFMLQLLSDDLPEAHKVAVRWFKDGGYKRVGLSLLKTPANTWRVVYSHPLKKAHKDWPYRLHLTKELLEKVEKIFDRTEGRSEETYKMKSQSGSTILQKQISKERYPEVWNALECFAKETWKARYGVDLPCIENREHEVGSICARLWERFDLANKTPQSIRQELWDLKENSKVSLESKKYQERLWDDFVYELNVHGTNGANQVLLNSHIYDSSNTKN